MSKIDKITDLPEKKLIKKNMTNEKNVFMCSVFEVTLHNIHMEAKNGFK
jgi:hypothetical protein